MAPRKPKGAPAGDGRQIDLVAVATARARLAELAELHPEAFRADRLPNTERKLARALAVDPDPLTVTAVKLRDSTRAALAERARELGTKPSTLARRYIEAALSKV